VHKDGPLITVTKPVEVCRLVRRVLKRFGGNQTKAGAAIGWSQEHVSRFAHNKIGTRMRDGLRRGLEKYFGREGMTAEIRRLRAALSNHKADAFHRGVYRRWLDRAVGLGPWVSVSVRGRAYAVRDGSHSTMEPTLAKWDARYAERVEKFRADHAHHDHDRVTLAIRRALNIPLIEDWAASGTVELSAQELHAKGLLDPYLRAALRREAILLQRSHDRQRIVELQETRRRR
jgi:hypothetical protein